jgi:hypothetical protein
MENVAGREAEMFLRIREASQKIFNLSGTPVQTVEELHINPAAVCMCDAKEHLAVTITI